MGASSWHGHESAQPQLEIERADQQAVEDRRPHLVVSCTVLLLALYQGLAHCYLTGAGFLMRPQPNGRTLIGRESKEHRRTLNAWLRWVTGRQQTGYEKMLLATARFPVRFDLYLLRYPTGSSVPAHVDPVDGQRHFRLNVVLREAELGGSFTCVRPIFETRRLKLFRPDVSEHSVSPIQQGSRLVLSLGWVRPNRRR